MCIRSLVRKILRVHGLLKRNRSKPRQNKCRAGNDTTEDGQRDSKPYRKSGCTQPLRLTSDRQMSSVLQNTEKGLYLNRRVSEILRRTQAVPDISTIAEPFPTRRNPLLVLSGLPDSCQFSSHQGRRWHTVASILHQQSLPRSRRKIFGDGKTGTSFRHRCQETATLLPVS